MRRPEEGEMAEDGNEPRIQLDRLSDRFFKYLFAFGHCTVSPQRKNDFPLTVESEAPWLRFDAVRCYSFYQGRSSAYSASISMKSNRVTSNSPISVSLISGMTGRDMKWWRLLATTLPYLSYLIRLHLPL